MIQHKRGGNKRNGNDGGYYLNQKNRKRRARERKRYYYFRVFKMAIPMISNVFQTKHRHSQFVERTKIGKTNKKNVICCS